MCSLTICFNLDNWKYASLHNIQKKQPRTVSAELEEVYADMGVTPDREFMVCCNTDYNAANIFFILKVLGYLNVRVYDYSWVKWNGKGFLPKIVGSAK